MNRKDIHRETKQYFMFTIDKVTWVFKYFTKALSFQYVRMVTLACGYLTIMMLMSWRVYSCKKEEEEVYVVNK